MLTQDEIDAFASHAEDALTALIQAIQRNPQFDQDADAHMLAVKCTRQRDEIASWKMWRRKHQGDVWP